MSPRVLQTKMRIRDILDKVKSEARLKSTSGETIGSIKKMLPVKVEERKPVDKNVDTSLLICNQEPAQLLESNLDPPLDLEVPQVKSDGES